MRVFLLLSFLWIGSSYAEQIPVTPNPEVTTGDYCDKTDPDFEGYRYPEKIAHCRRDVSRDRRAHIYEVYKIPSRCRRNYTVDHFIPLSMGGSNANENLWPEHRRIKASRFELEQDLFNKLSEGQISREEAVKQVMEAKMNPDLSSQPINDSSEDCQR